jgi:hypothetical protein
MNTHVLAKSHEITSTRARARERQREREGALLGTVPYAGKNEEEDACEEEDAFDMIVGALEIMMCDCGGFKRRRKRRG